MSEHAGYRTLGRITCIFFLTPREGLLCRSCPARSSGIVKRVNFSCGLSRKHTDLLEKPLLSPLLAVRCRMTQRAPTAQFTVDGSPRRSYYCGSSKNRPAQKSQCAGDPLTPDQDVQNSPSGASGCVTTVVCIRRLPARLATRMVPSEIDPAVNSQWILPSLQQVVAPRAGTNACAYRGLRPR